VISSILILIFFWSEKKKEISRLSIPHSQKSMNSNIDKKKKNVEIEREQTKIESQNNK
jgi:hypothetical protein